MYIAMYASVRAYVYMYIFPLPYRGTDRDRAKARRDAGKVPGGKRRGCDARRRKVIAAHGA